MTPAAVSRAARRARRSRSRSSIRPSAGCSSRARTKGLCSVKLGDRDETLEQDLRTEYPAADDPARARRVCRMGARARRALDGRAPKLDLPLDVKATAFQWKVWRYLQSIPYGETRAYSEVAEGDWRAAGHSRRRARLRDQSRLPRHPVPPRRAEGRRARRLSLGRRAKTQTAAEGKAITYNRCVACRLRFEPIFSHFSPNSSSIIAAFARAACSAFPPATLAGRCSSV